MAESEKYARKLTKTKFTRKLNDFNKCVADGKEHRITNVKFLELSDAWHALENAQDAFMCAIDNEEHETEEKDRENLYLSEAQEDYTNALGVNMGRSDTAADSRHLQHHKEYRVDTDTLDGNMSGHGSSDTYLTTPHRHSTVSERIEMSASQHRMEENANQQRVIPVQVEKIKLPRFSGKITDYARFKTDFTRYIQPHVALQTLSYTLRSCLSPDAAHLVRNVDDNVKEIWRLLDDRYADTAKITEVIMDRINHVRPFNAEDPKRFVEFVDLVEDSYNDLKKMGIEHELTNTTTLGAVEKKLPPDMQKLWAMMVSNEGSEIDQGNKFPELLKFMRNQKRAIEYRLSKMRTTSSSILNAEAAEFSNNVRVDRADIPPVIMRCLFHSVSDHWTSDCALYLAKTADERRNVLRQRGACFSCLRIGHVFRECRQKRPCGIRGCSRRHHPSLHDVTTEAITPNSNANPGSSTTYPAPSYRPESTNADASTCNDHAGSECMLLIQKIPTPNSNVSVLWDNGASLCFVRNEMAKREGLSGTRANLSIVKVGGVEEMLPTMKFKLQLVDKDGEIVTIDAYGIDKITSDIKTVNVDGIASKFQVDRMKIERPTGAVDVLIGYNYAGYHPIPEQYSGHLVLLQNRFGKCIGGKCGVVDELYQTYALNNVTYDDVNTVSIEDFYKIENLGIECTPRCGNCRCGKCPLGSKDYTLQEERELKLIENGLHYDAQNLKWTAEYPWIKEPTSLLDNRKAAFGMLLSTEKRLAKNHDHAATYQKQITDMIERGVARKVSESEMKEYQGPVHYLAHHEVLKPDSNSTPVRIVFNSSANYMGHTLNDYWAKGPDLLNNLCGVLLRFRENEVALVGDIKKMYHAVNIGLTEQHTHRFLWRDMDTTREPDTYIVQTVSFGDKPAGTIAMLALRKTADMNRDEFSDANDVIQKNTYMDDIIDSVSDIDSAKRLTSDIEQSIAKGGFALKEWIYSGEQRENTPLNYDAGSTEDDEKILGMHWNSQTDTFQFKVKLNFSKKKRKIHEHPDLGVTDIPSSIPQNLTKRMILSQVNRIYDPLGLAGPFTVRAKIMLRKLTGAHGNLDWDDAVPPDHKLKWLEFFSDLFEMESIEFTRCLKPRSYVGDPSLIIFSDGSDNAYGACAYVRWTLADGSVTCSLVASKNRLAPIKKMSIDRIELCAAVLNKRLKVFVANECRYNFSQCYHIVDSQIVRAMVQKESYGFNTFAAVRIGEIQQGTNPQNWYWIEGDLNVADYLTRGKRPSEIGAGSDWQCGPDFLKLPINEWPISKSCGTQDLPEQVKVALTTEDVDTETIDGLDISRFSTYTKLLRVTARVLSIFNRRGGPPSFRNASRSLTPDDIHDAEMFWIREAQKTVVAKMKDGGYIRLCPRIRDDGIVVVGGRADRWLHMSYNQTEVPLLPHEHGFAQLYARHIHDKGHYGVSATVSKIRSRFWIVRAHIKVKAIKYRCVLCKKLAKKTAEQVMGRLPIERLKPAPAWTNTGVDLFGPFRIRDEVKKRTIGKAYGIVFNCLATRAVYVDIAPDYSTEKFMMVLRRFVSLHGYPSSMMSDNGTQLVAANDELRKISDQWDWDELRENGLADGMKWKFTSADAPWQNGCTEALVKSVKKAIVCAIGDSVLTFSELQTVCFEAANLVNERPIGRHPTSPEDGTYLCPNDLLLGRATSRAPSGPFRETSNPRHRFEFVQKIATAFWVKWTRDLFPNLVVRQKWHTEHRNLMVGDVVLIQDASLVRGKWRLGKVSDVKPGIDGKVRNVDVQYKNARVNEKNDKYRGSNYVTISRPVHRLVVILPVDQSDDDSS